MFASSGPDLYASQHPFTLLTNHAHVLVLIAQHPTVRMREIAAMVGITERAVQRIVEDLTATGFIVVTKDGRRNHYEIQPDLPLRHPLDRHRTVGDLIRLIVPGYRKDGQASDQERSESSDSGSSPVVDRRCGETASNSDGSVFSEQACSQLLDALDRSSAVMPHGAELGSGEE